jgi:hypothetical protein
VGRFLKFPPRRARSPRCSTNCRSRGEISALEDRAGKVVSDVSGLTTKLKENPSLLLNGPKEKSAADNFPVTAR